MEGEGARPKLKREEKPLENKLGAKQKENKRGVRSRYRDKNLKL